VDSPATRLQKSGASASGQTIRPIRRGRGLNTKKVSKKPRALHHQVRHRREGKASGLYFDSTLPQDDVRKVSLGVVSPLKGQRADCAWFRGGWFDALTMLTNDLQQGKLKTARQSPSAMQTGRSRFGATLFWDLELNPGEQVEVPIIYAWHAANSELGYGQSDQCSKRNHRPYYATQFANAWEVSRYAIEHFDSLHSRTRRFHRALFNTTLPNYVLDAISANLAILKSPTVLRQEDGMMWCWEGSSYENGCCAGSCTHVCNYAQAMPYLFPKLERTLRDLELKHSMDRRGHVTFRSALPTGDAAHGFHAASDGQLGVA
jgi:hypothetical protein